MGKEKKIYIWQTGTEVKASYILDNSQCRIIGGIPALLYHIRDLKEQDYKIVLNRTPDGRYAPNLTETNREKFSSLEKNL